jgi:hypothetical protein
MAREVQGGPEKDWIPARLIPTAGIRGQEEQEKRATSALLAVLPAVPDFGHALLSGMGAPKGRISTFTEVRLKDDGGKTHIPDGAIVVERGKTRWSCLVEVKTARIPLEASQVDRYLQMARLHGFDGLLTISNQIRTDPDALPYEVDRRRVGKLRVQHLSWWRVLTEAIVQHRFRGIKDPDQAWILGELIRYLDDERSGASGFEGMGEEWVRVREAARMGSLRAGDPEARTIAARWEQFIEYLCLQLSQELGVTVQHQKARAKNAQERVAAATQQLASDGILRGAFRVPDAIGPVTVEANLASGRVTTSVEIDAPKDIQRPKARINWLLRQLREAPDDLRIDVLFAQRRSTTSELLRDCREAPERLLLEDDPKRDPRAFVAALSRAMGKKKGRTEGSFVSETRRQAMDFYRDLVQELQPPRPKAPRMKEPEETQRPEPTETTAPRPETESQIRREQETHLESIAELERWAPLRDQPR